ncbi:MAG TPA: hypothetical protein VK584_06360, partial [Streptosporangiaceae bacterium]|nr:hypothetical protein [Streptosporangiaceae bacterium]
MEQDNAHHDPPDKEGARWAGRDDCGLPEHPDLSCAGAAEFIRARTRWDLPRTYGSTRVQERSMQPLAPAMTLAG